MKFLERFALVVYSYIIIIIAVILGLVSVDLISLEQVVDVINPLISGEVASKVTLGICIVFLALSIKCIFFDEKTKEKIREAQGILLKNENGELMISKESIDNMVKNAVSRFDDVKECETKIYIDEEKQIMITLCVIVNENVVIKDLASDLQLKIKDEIRKIADLDVKEVNVKVIKLQEPKKKSKDRMKENGEF